MSTPIGAVPIVYHDGDAKIQNGSMVEKFKADHSSGGTIGQSGGSWDVGTTDGIGCSFYIASTTHAIIQRLVHFCACISIPLACYSN